MDLKISGKTALITGATGGLGRATADILKFEGVTLFLTDTDEDALDKACTELECRGEIADLSSADGVEKFIKSVGSAFDILVHTAGITGEKGDPLHMSEDAWENAWNIDFMSAVRLAKHIGPKMIENKWGRMVFITSENVAQPYPDETVYNSSKSALLSFSKSIAMAHSGSGLLSNCVAPAFIATDMTDGMMEKRAEEMDASFDEAIESFLQEERPYLVMKRRGKVEEVAPVIALLCSELASFTTGSNYRVDGGAVGSIDI